MNDRRISLKILLLVLTVLGGLVFYSYNGLAQTGNITATVQVRGCGNGIIEDAEQCDGAALGGETCVSQGYDSGDLACQANCTFNVSDCSSTPASYCGDGTCDSGESCSSCSADCGGCGGGGGGGGGGSPPRATEAILQGKAYPGAEMTVLVDGQVATTIEADAQSNFKVILTTLSGGTYTFGLWAEDSQGRKSITFSFTTAVPKKMTTTVTNIFIPPTIELDKPGVEKGEVLNILGQSAPQSEITISVHSAGVEKKALADEDGFWEHALETDVLEEGAHTIRAKAETPEGLLSSYSKVLGFYIGEEVPVQAERGDINGDGKVNLVDFSVLLYNWGIPKNPVADLNNDGKVDLIDFSIMLYWWTG